MHHGGMYYGLYNASILLLLPAIILTVYAQAKVKSTFNKFLHVRTIRGYTGAQAARQILDRNGLQNVNIEYARGTLSDHYDPRGKVLRLSQAVHNGTSIASVSVAAHEAGHALQHAKGYVPLSLRNSIAPVVSVASKAAWPLIFIGLVLSGAGTDLLTIGILFYSLAVVFQVITLPVEFNASSRAIVELQSSGIINSEEKDHSKKVLSAAALTYVAAMAASLAQLLRLILIRNSRD